MVTKAHKITAKSARVHSPRPFTFARCTVPHAEHIDRNEDTLLIDQQLGLAAVFDGVGSGPGQMASRLAARTIHRGWKKVFASPHTDIAPFERDILADISTTFPRLMNEASEQIRSEGQRLEAARDPMSISFSRPATTAALVAFCRNSENNAYIMAYAHVGDSRIYLLREHEALRRLTTDDGFFTVLQKDGRLDADDILRIDQATTADQLSPIELGFFKQRNGITQALGGTNLNIHVDHLALLPNDRILLCTDGIHDNLTDAELEAIMLHKAGSAIAKKLVQQAVQQSKQDRSISLRAKADDMSAVVIVCH